jgi:excisionase family DNA binding protein
MVTAVEERYYTVAEVADLLGLHANTVRRMIRRGEMGYSRHTRWLRVSFSDLNAYMEGARRHHPEPVAPKGRRRSK